MPPAEPLAEQFEAAWRLHQFLAAHDIPYALIGGLALQKWGNPRFTLDVDVTVLVDAGEEEPLIRELTKAFRPRIDNAVAGRPQDLIDLQTVIEREGHKLDLAYIRKWLRVLAEAAEEPAMVERFEEPWQRVMGRG